ncbi:Oidioi.mRNA.OKI2018_I69.PAR.g12006.t1.cds [Oikopleura dioica]|uniref:Oidioi.mRNA.OKI2018_I69.PAR.g12006.t1.cds n=1 Tax=Oikopleura dioica TaxID=34765 RepID=A0ABN7S5S1_OIKDI|nr:Oidioi.mRNA.OKI2018_I69.PAR.g12006.t1.cds [Oikopleura dioica]
MTVERSAMSKASNLKRTLIPVLAELECDGVGNFEVKSERFSVGRGQNSNMPIASSNLVSRKHIEFLRDREKGTFNLVCNGKNGIFVDGIFHKTTLPDGQPIELKESCLVRFPSTKIQIRFKSLLNRSGESQQKQLALTKQEVPESPSGFAGQKEESHDALDNIVANEDSSINDENSGAKFRKKYPSENENSESKPPYSYAQLIIQAISSAEEHQLTLAGIYQYITKFYPYYKNCDKGWQNSIRHNLSLNRYFIKVPRGQEEPGKGSFWRIDQGCESKLIEQAWRKRSKGKFDGEPLSKRYKDETPPAAISSSPQPVQPQPTQQVVYQQKPAAPQPQILRTANGQQLLLVQDNGGGGAQQMMVQREPPKQRPQVQQIQIPASMAGQQLVVAQMPDGRQQIFALQGNQGTPVQLVQQGGQIMQQIVQAGVQQQAGTQLIMTSGGLKQVVQAQPAPQRTIQPHPAATTRIVQRQATPPAATAAATAPTPATTESESLMPNEELNGIDSEHTLGTEAGIEDSAPVDSALESSENVPVDDPPVHEEVVQEEIVQENLENAESNSEPTE